MNSFEFLLFSRSVTHSPLSLPLYSVSDSASPTEGFPSPLASARSLVPPLSSLNSICWHCRFLVSKLVPWTTFSLFVRNLIGDPLAVPSDPSDFAYYMAVVSSEGFLLSLYPLMRWDKSISLSLDFASDLRLKTLEILRGFLFAHVYFSGVLWCFLCVNSVLLVLLFACWPS